MNTLKRKMLSRRILTLFCLLICSSLLAQKNIGEFNHKENKISGELGETLKSLDSEYYRITSDRQGEYTAVELEPNISKLRQLLQSYEERLKQSKNALQTLPEKSGEKSTNMEYKFWTESLIQGYQHVLEIILPARIKRTEEAIKLGE